MIATGLRGGRDGAMTTMTTNTPSTPAGAQLAGPIALDLRNSRHLSALPRALLCGSSQGLLEPLRFVALDERLRPVPRAQSAVRERLAESLAGANRALGHRRADELAAALARPATRVVTTGQQPGLFGGPLYSLSKAVAASRVAAQLEAAGEPAVAVFWVASEDHDFAEVAQAFLGPLGRLSLGEDPEPLRPVGPRRLGAEVSALLESARAAATPLQRRFVEQLGQWYRPEATFADAFGRLLVALLGEHCPLLLDALDPTLKELERPHLRRLVERREDVDRALAAAAEKVTSAGFSPQVSPRSGASPLFVLADDGARRRVEWEGPDAFRLRGTHDSQPVADLLERLEEQPGRVSPGVLGRPVVQDAVLGSSLLVLGPGELSYMAQAAGLYSVLEVEAPDAALRPQVLLALPKERERLEWLAERGIDLEVLLAEPHELERRLAGSAGRDRVRPAAARVDAVLEELRSALVELEPQLESPYEKTRQQVSRAFETLAGKTDAAFARRDETLRARAEGLRETLLPEGVLQERRLATAWAAATFGDGVGRFLYSAMPLVSDRVPVLTLDPEASSGGAA
jgi:bacillithiol biosynthesis cysteine-adding enzyme BshC